MKSVKFEEHGTSLGSPLHHSWTGLEVALLYPIRLGHYFRWIRTQGLTNSTGTPHCRPPQCYRGLVDQVSRPLHCTYTPATLTGNDVGICLLRIHCLLWTSGVWWVIPQLVSRFNLRLCRIGVPWGVVQQCSPGLLSVGKVRRGRVLGQFGSDLLFLRRRSSPESVKRWTVRQKNFITCLGQWAFTCCCCVGRGRPGQSSRTRTRRQLLLPGPRERVTGQSPDCRLFLLGRRRGRGVGNYYRDVPRGDETYPCT